MSEAPSIISEECSAVYFYGVEGPPTAPEDFYCAIVDWFTGLGYPPDKLCISFPGRNGNFAPFSRGNAKLKKSGFDNVTGLEIIATTPVPARNRDYYLTSIYVGDPKDSYAGLVAKSSIAMLSAPSMLRIARRLGEILKPAYGIGFTRENRLGPEYYALGLCYGGNPVLTGAVYEEERNISRWFDLGMVEEVYRDGLIRDVYPWNFLTEPQLARPVGSLRLDQWIQEDSTRGTLSKLSGEVLIWEVEAASIDGIRRELHEADVIFDWRKFV